MSASASQIQQKFAYPSIVLHSRNEQTRKTAKGSVAMKTFATKQEETSRVPVAYRFMAGVRSAVR